MRKRIWWTPQVPMKRFCVEVQTFREARLLLNTLAEYDRFQWANNIKPDYCNVGGLQTFDPDDHEDGPKGSWTDWHGDEVDEFDNLTDDQIAEMDIEENVQAIRHARRKL